MKVSFAYDEKDGFRTDVENKTEVILKNSLSNNTKHFSPTEHLLLAMGGCSSDDILNILTKMKEPISGFRCEISGERREENPKTLTHVNIHFIFKEKISPVKARKAINLSLTKYCSVSIIVKQGGADLRYSLTIDGKNYDFDKLPEQALAEAPEN
ncbi:MAG: OsmC family protein [Candidatus Thermoplasmatota archaeon]|nr:OsmC family protein [Candidatus Thermoplasmatota archaeon]MCL6089516.1 OsmC family protein [Candidatus Thermoplasmatota archaeon]